MRRLAVLPFDTTLAGLVLVSGLLALRHFGGLGLDPLSAQLPGWLEMVCNLLYALAGTAWLAGLGSGRGDLEAFGLTGVAAGITMRAVALVWFVGWSSAIFVVLVFDVMVLGACMVRLKHLIQGRVLLLGGPQR